MAPETRLPEPIPMSTTASMTAKAVEYEATYKRRKRNHTTSRQRRMQPVPKLTKSKRQGSRYLGVNRSGNVACEINAAVLPSVLATSKAIAAATQPAKAAATLVP